MSLIVNGGRLEPPNGIPDQIYTLMLACWSTVDTDRPYFDDIIEILNSMLQVYFNISKYHFFTVEAFLT